MSRYVRACLYAAFTLVKTFKHGGDTIQHRACAQSLPCRAHHSNSIKECLIWLLAVYQPEWMMGDDVAAFLNAAETARQTITLFSIVWAHSACPEAPTTDPFIWQRNGWSQ